MALQLKKKVAPVTPLALVEEAVYDGADLIDRVGALAPEAEKIEEKIKALKKQLEPYKEAEKALVAYVTADASLDPDKEHVLLGKTHKVKVGRRGNSRMIADIKKVMKIMGVETFMKVVKVNITDMDRYMTGKDVEACTTTERTDRPVKEVSKRGS